MTKNIMYELLEKRPDIAQWHKDFSKNIQRITKDLNTMTEKELKAKYPNYNPGYNPNYIAIPVSQFEAI